ncbi:MAG: hypothetical protein L3J51_04200 [Cocleimonas sp.]|nr:hypothetical protein [Cocleimonas sp.]
MLQNLRNSIWQTIVDWLNDIPKGNQDMQAINNFDHMIRDLRPADVVLFEGRTRVSEVIKIITLSPWTHAALYIGRLSDIADPDARAIVQKNYDGDPDKPLVIESLLGFGTIVNPLTDYADDNLRICRPTGLSYEDQNKVVNFATEHIGMNYDVRQLLDLARFMVPYGVLPRRWRSSLFQHNAGRPTNIVCSSMIARCFQSVNYPMLPVIKTDNNDRLLFHKRNFRLFVPTDFDYSPYFKVLKFPAWPLSMKEGYRDLPWTDEDPEEPKKEKLPMKQQAKNVLKSLNKKSLRKKKEEQDQLKKDRAYEPINLR